MNPQLAASAVARRPQRRRGLALAVALALALPGSAFAQKKKRRDPARRPAPSAPADAGDEAEAPKQPAASGKGKVQVFDFSGLELQGSMRTPQLLYFLGRASEELRRASLERRSFVPEMVRSLEEAPL